MDEKNEVFLYPTNLNTFSPPNDKDLLLAYKVHKPSIESLTLKSENGRAIFAEAFIDNSEMNTLDSLAVKALANTYGIKFAPIFAHYPLRLRMFYDSIDIDSPLEKIYEIEDIPFWKRLVLAKTKDQTIQFKDDKFAWKNYGISLKYAEMVEECPAEFWPEKRMESLATNVKDFVKELHIHKLQYLKDYVFERYLGRDSDTEKSDSTDVSSSTPKESESISSVSIEEGIGEEEEDHPQKVSVTVRLVGLEDIDKLSSNASSETTVLKAISSEMERAQISQFEWAAFEAKRAGEKAKVTEERKMERRARREAQNLRREKREEKRLLKMEKLLQPKPKNITVQSVFDLPIEEEQDEEPKKMDKRNLANVLAQKKAYDYPAKHCHHVDLSFVRLFDNLADFSVEFNPPELQEKYHTRYFKFSYDDVSRLAIGISELESLRIFRLRHSRMDERKLRMLCGVLKNMNVEVVDFSSDELKDDCDDAIYDLFQNTTTIKSLELGGNLLGSNVMRRLSMALRKYEGALEYLGLSRNPLSDEALHALCSVIYKTAQVQSLNLAGIQFSQPTIMCCIANELLKKHTILKELDLMAMTIGARAAEAILAALKENNIVQIVECRGCDLTFEYEFEIEVCVRRNRYLVENPYIGDTEKTEEEIQAFVSRVKNPILQKVQEGIEARRTCIENRPDVAERFSMASIASDVVRQHSFLTVSALFPIEKSTAQAELVTEETEHRGTLKPIDLTPFEYNPNEFNEEQFRIHVNIPGPGQRYYYFQTRREQRLCSRNE